MGLYSTEDEKWERQNGNKLINKLISENDTYYKANAVDGNSQSVWWLGLHASTARGPGSLPGRGTKILQAARCGPKKKKKKKAIENEW